MTTTYEGDKVKVEPICKKHKLAFLRNFKDDREETIDILYCTKCFQKVVLIWDEPAYKLVEKTKAYLKEMKEK
jgi:hypothetical protein